MSPGRGAYSLCMLHPVLRAKPERRKKFIVCCEVGDGMFTGEVARTHWGSVWRPRLWPRWPDWRGILSHQRHMFAAVAPHSCLRRMCSTERPRWGRGLAWAGLAAGPGKRALRSTRRQYPCGGGRWGGSETAPLVCAAAQREKKKIKRNESTQKRTEKGYLEAVVQLHGVHAAVEVLSGDASADSKAAVHRPVQAV